MAADNHYCRTQIVDNCRYLFPDAQPLLVTAATETPPPPNLGWRSRAAVVDTTRPGRILVTGIVYQSYCYSDCNYVLNKLLHKTEKMVYEKLEAQEKEQELWLRASMLNENNTTQEAESEAGDGDEPVFTPASTPRGAGSVV